ncbi:MAG: right-handed parallel beta-helix repeat-containing protein [Solirubrobacterales bacterium]
MTIAAGALLLAALAGAALVLMLAGPATAEAKKIRVTPGKNAIQRAVNTARPGDVLRIKDGRYRESVVIDKRLTLRGIGNQRPTIDGRCKTNITVAVTAGGVKLKQLKVVGAAEGFGFSPSQVDFRFLGKGKANDLVLRETCDGLEAAEYGVNLLGVRKVTVANSLAKGGHTDAGFYVGGVTGTGNGKTVLKGNRAFGNTVGIVMEQSRGDIRVLDNNIHDNTAPGVHDPGGILVNVAIGSLYEDNRVVRNGLYGIDLVPGSDSNVLNGNTFTGNEIDVIDEGTGNCGSANTIGSGPAFPAC